MSELLRLEGITKSYRMPDGSSLDILSGIDLSLREGEVVSIAGRSGSGKSTLLSIAALLLAPDAGRILYEGRDVSGLSSKEMQRLRSRSVGFVFQSSLLLEDFTVLENAAMPLLIQGMKPREAYSEAERLLDKVGLLDRRDYRPRLLSGGERQRAAIARAAAPRPKLLLLDEPTSALDPEYTVEVLDVVNELKDAGNDFIIVTHEMGFARHACEKTAFFANASLEEFGPSEALFTAPQTPGLKRFLGRLLEWSV